MGANLNEKICRQISPVFDATKSCSADRTEARCSFEPGEKQSPPSDDLAKQIACLSKNVLAVFILLLSVIISLLKLVQFILGEKLKNRDRQNNPHAVTL